jgi:hypothetical protein
LKLPREEKPALDNISGKRGVYLKTIYKGYYLSVLQICMKGKEARFLVSGSLVLFGLTAVTFSFQYCAKASRYSGGLAPIAGESLI